MSNGNGLPKGWARAQISEIVDLKNGYAFKPSDWQEDGLPIIRIQNLNNPQAVFNHYPGSLPERFRIKSGDLLFAWSGTPGTSFGAHIWRGDDAWLNQHIFRVDFDSRFLEERFLQMAINCNLNDYIGQAHGGAGLAHITKGKFESSELLIAPLTEQRRIVAKVEELFSDLEAGVAALERVRAKLKRYRAAVLKAAVEGKLTADWRKKNRPKETGRQLLDRILAERRHRWEEEQLAAYEKAGKKPPAGWKDKYKEPAGPDEGSLPELPEGWCWTTAGQLCSQVTDGEHNQPRYQEIGLPMLTATHVRDGFVSFSDAGLIASGDFERARRRCGPMKGDLLIVCVGATTGRTAIVSTSTEFALVRSVLLLKPMTDGDYLLTSIRSPQCQQWISRASGASAQAHFYISDAKRMPIPLPPRNEQCQIIAEVGERLLQIERSAELINANLKRSARLRQSILKRAFEGKLVPQDPKDEPASVLLERIKATQENGRPKTTTKPARKSK